MADGRTGGTETATASPVVSPAVPVLSSAAAEAPDPALKPRHFAGFDGLRAIAAVSILFLHTAYVSGFTTTSSFGIYTSRLEIGVSVFFLISGFLLYRPFAVSHLTGQRSPDTRRFWERRLLRIVPAYWLALTLLAYVFHVISLGPGAGEAAIHYFFLQIYFPKAVFFGIPQAWSICTEMSFYLFIPLYAAVVGLGRLAQRTRMAVELFGLAALVVVSVIFRWWASHLPVIKVVNGHFEAVCYPHCSTQSPFPALMVDWLPARLDLFALGMLLAVLSAWWTERRSEPSWLSNRMVPWVSWIAAAFVYWCVSHMGIPVTPLYLTTPIKAIELQSFYGVFAFLLLLPVVFGPEDRSLIRRLLTWWPIASLGVISYGIYLWHLDMIDPFISWTGYQQFHVPYVVLALGVLTVTVAIATLSYFLVERPILHIKDHLGWWNRAPDAPSEEREEMLTQ